MCPIKGPNNDTVAAPAEGQQKWQDSKWLERLVLGRSERPNR